MENKESDRIYINNKNKQEYALLGIARDATNNNALTEMAVYRAVVGGQLYVRELEEFYIKFTEAEKDISPREILTYDLAVGLCTLSIPKGTKALHVGNQRGAIKLWAESPVSEERVEQRRFIVCPTGAPFMGRADRDYIGTVPVSNEGWHVYEEVGNEA